MCHVTRSCVNLSYWCVTVVSGFLVLFTHCTLQSLKWIYHWNCGASHANCHQNVKLYCSNTLISWMIAVCNGQKRTRNPETTCRCKDKVAVLFGTEKNPLWLGGTCWLYQWASLANTWMITPNVSTTMRMSLSVVVFISGWYKTESDLPATDKDKCTDKN